jgi:CheY-like chemotaxis protein
MQPLKLLVVEDHIPSLELMTEVFISLKAEVSPISDSKKAVAIVNQEKFDGIFLDLEMPNLNGFDLARLVRKSSWNKPCKMHLRLEQHFSSRSRLTGRSLAPCSER